MYVLYARILKRRYGYSGREKGMRANYARAFEAGLGDGFKIAAQAIIGSELVYIIKRVCGA